MKLDADWFKPLEIINYELCVISCGNKVVDEEIRRLARRVNELLDENAFLKARKEVATA